jgi:cell wall-associated NlpC family hydrolase
MTRHRFRFLSAGLLGSLLLGALFFAEPRVQTLKAADSPYSFSLSNANTFVTGTTATDANRATVTTPLGNNVKFFYGGLVKATGTFATIYGQGYLYNQWALTGIQSLTITYSGTGTLRLAYGFAVGNYLYHTTEITSGTPISLSIHPNFFCLENTSGAKPYATSYVDGTTTKYSYTPSFDSVYPITITSLSFTYSCTNEATASQKLHQYIDVTASSLNVRKGPGTSYAILGTVSKNTYDHQMAYRETVLDTDGDPWFRTYYMNQDAYVSGSSTYTTLKQATELGNQDVEAMIVEGEKRIDDRYLLGATRYITTTGVKQSSFDECYYDCSSFTMRAAYDGAGILLGNYTGAQIKNGTKVSTIAELKRGDIVLFTSGSTDISEANVGHVTLWTGDDLMIQASGADYTGTVKMHANFQGYWKAYFIEGRRIA